MKKKKDLGPRRKRMNRAKRLQNARATKWIEKYEGKDLVNGYRRWYGIDALSAVVELQQLGVPGLGEREKKIRRDVELKQKANADRKARREQEEEWPLERDETFAYIAGYTPGGAPYGVTWEEWEQIK
jgi:hypothetical protein